MLSMTRSLTHAVEGHQALAVAKVLFSLSGDQALFPSSWTSL